MTQLPASAFSGSRMSSGLHAPPKSSSVGYGRLPRRFTNQAASGTSSKASTFRASFGGSTAKSFETGRKSVLSAASHASGDRYGSGAHETWLGSFSVGRFSHLIVTGRRSVSTDVASRSGKRRPDPPQPARTTHVAIAKVRIEG